MKLLLLFIALLTVLVMESADARDHKKAAMPHHVDEESDIQVVGKHNPAADAIRWPHLMGVDKEEALKHIQATRPDLQVQTVPSDAMVTMDFRTDRVRIFVDGNGKVVREPRVG